MKQMYKKGLQFHHGSLNMNVKNPQVKAEIQHFNQVMIATVPAKSFVAWVDKSDNC